jgi:UDP-N-acetylmuramoyl-tripeptide--D-alanyl-D-alanine ligase
MSFWTLENIKTTLGGKWLARGEDKGPGGPPPLNGLSTDSRSVKPGQVFLALKGEKTDGHEYLAQAAEAGAGMLIVDQAGAVPVGLNRPVAILLVADTGAALLKLAGAYRRTLETTKVIAVGGSNGKTTTVKLIGAVLSQTLRGTVSAKSFNNAVGVPLTILGAKRTDQYLVCEVGTNAPGEIAVLAAVVQPDIAVITSIGREHLEGLGSLKGVLQEEVSLLSGLRPGGTALLSSDAPGLVETAAALLNASGKSLISFGAAEKADIRVSACEQSFEGLRVCLNDRNWYALPLMGAHNASNAAAATGVARRLGVSNEGIEAGLASAKGPEMRLERSVVGGVSFINDAYNANPESALAAFKAFREVAGPAFKRRVLVLGDMLELGDTAPELHREVGEGAARTGAELVILVGGFAKNYADGLTRGGWEGQVVTLADLDEQRDVHAAGLLKQGDIVLLKGSRRMALERVIQAIVRTRGGAHVEPGPGAPARSGEKVSR